MTYPSLPSGRAGIETLNLLGLTPDCSLSLLMNIATQKVASVCVITTFSSIR